MFKFEYKDWTAVHKNIWSDLLKSSNLLEERDKNIVEVGCFEGRSTVWFANKLINTPNSRYFCIDSWKGGEEIERLKLNYDMELVYSNFCENIKQLPCYPQITIIKSNSEKALVGLPFLYRNVDFLYLDGSHTQRDTLVDLVHGLSLLKVGGILIVDDYSNNMATSDISLRATMSVDFVVSSFKSEITHYVTEEGQMVIKRVSD
jgi:predicted O-methyltransferase YrrM